VACSFSARDRSQESRIDVSRRDTPHRACNADRSLIPALNGIILQRRARGIDEAAQKYFDTTAGLCEFRESMAVNRIFDARIARSRKVR